MRRTIGRSHAGNAMGLLVQRRWSGATHALATGRNVGASQRAQQSTKEPTHRTRSLGSPVLRCRLIAPSILRDSGTADRFARWKMAVQRGQIGLGEGGHKSPLVVRLVVGPQPVDFEMEIGIVGEQTRQELIGPGLPSAIRPAEVADHDQRNVPAAWSLGISRDR